MSNNMTSEIATGMVEQIESLQGQIAGVYERARKFDGMNNDNVIRDIIDARKAAREAADEAGAMIASFDFDDMEVPF